LNQVVEEQYRTAEHDEERSRLAAQCTRLLTKRIGRLKSRLSEVANGAHDTTRPDQLRHVGDLLLANIWRIKPGDTAVEVEDYEDENRIVRIALEPDQDAAAQANALYERARRAEESRTFLEASAASLTGQISSAEALRDAIPSYDLSALRELAAELSRTTRRGQAAGGTLPGLEFSTGGFRILVGRNARENDQLLRRHVRGNDWWLHTRDYAGGYVFIKNQPGKSIPLEVLLDAGTLAVFFSKARRAGKADLYYTQVKHLRRAKDGPLGLVLPTQERNLSVEITEERLASLGIGSDLGTE
jgi:predicted ribosome quality control (RQC) complex YloA/Tae2 family protein